MRVMVRVRNSAKEHIQQMVNHTVRQSRPEKTILFASQAQGRAKPESDVDLLVVMPVPGSRREKAVEISVACTTLPLPRMSNRQDRIPRPARREVSQGLFGVQGNPLSQDP